VLADPRMVTRRPQAVKKLASTGDFGYDPLRRRCPQRADGMRREKKTRLDEALVARGLAPDKAGSQAMIMAGEVWVNGQKSDRPDHRLGPGELIEVRRKRAYVSRGALKLAKAVRDFAITVSGLNVLDIGVSTGGFSDFLLQLGAAAVLGVDVNIDQVDSGLRADPRLRLLRKNARFLARGDVPFEPDLVVMDLSFISVTAVLPVLAAFEKARILALVKPQFEAPRGRVGRGGVVRDRGKRLDILLAIKRRIEELDYGVEGCTAAGVRGRKGNQEFFFLLRRGKNNSIDDTIIADAVEF
jgi:23S rRNA (cytidine1920-2'-O)/16S rRNA (cytidine1409-2'-O)-methyltransferase